MNSTANSCMSGDADESSPDDDTPTKTTRKKKMTKKQKKLTKKPNDQQNAQTPDSKKRGGSDDDTQPKHKKPSRNKKANKTTQPEYPASEYNAIQSDKASNITTNNPIMEANSTATTPAQNNPRVIQDTSMQNLQGIVMETKVTLQGNVEKILERGEGLGELETRAANLKNNSKQFKQYATDIKTKQQKCHTRMICPLSLVTCGAICLILATILYSIYKNEKNVDFSKASVSLLVIGCILIGGGLLSCCITPSNILDCVKTTVQDNTLIHSQRK